MAAQESPSITGEEILFTHERRVYLNRNDWGFFIGGQAIIIIRDAWGDGVRINVQAPNGVDIIRARRGGQTYIIPDQPSCRIGNLVLKLSVGRAAEALPPMRIPIEEALDNNEIPDRRAFIGNKASVVYTGLNAHGGQCTFLVETVGEAPIRVLHGADELVAARNELAASIR